MPTFPKPEADVVALAETMIAGLTAHAADFPNVDPAPLSTALTAYQADRQAQANARAQTRIATEAKDEALDALVSRMKNDLKLSEVDAAADPAKLTLIGWGTKAPPVPIVAPGQPKDLRPTVEGHVESAGVIQLDWTKPAGGGPVRNYLLQRRQQTDPSGPFTEWMLIETVYTNTVLLNTEPRGMQLEYRVIASNAAGQSLPSNSAAAVL